MSCIIQGVLYPWMINTCNLAIPSVAIIGMICMCLGIATVTLPTIWLMILASTILSIGYCLSAPTAVTILSVSSEKSRMKDGNASIDRLMNRRQPIPTSRARSFPTTTSSHRLPRLSPPLPSLEFMRSIQSLFSTSQHVSQPSPSLRSFMSVCGRTTRILERLPCTSRMKR